MTWFKVDDSLDTHPKVIAIPRARRARVLGVWLQCGTWSARHSTDGHIPAAVVADMGATADARTLVDVGLWVVDDDGGWRFHDWQEYQPTRAAVEARRAQRAAAGAKGGVSSGVTRRLRAVGEDTP